MADADAVAGPPERASDLTEMGLIEKSKLDDRTNEDALTDAGHETPAGATRVLFSKYVTDESRATTLHDRLDTQL